MSELRPLRVLVACEESQTVCKAFRARGHEAYSCDIQPCSGGRPDWHIHGNVLEYLDRDWDLMIGHPPCTYLSRAGQSNKSRSKEVWEYRESKATEAIEFMKALWNSPIPKICLENPVGLANTRWRKPTQIVHPYYFGDAEMKETCFWLKGLSRLNGLPHIDRVRDKPKPLSTRMGSDGQVKNKYFCGVGDCLPKGIRAKFKSKTFEGIAQAMASQWSPDLTEPIVTSCRMSPVNGL